MLDFDELRKEVAIRHNVLLGKDDPILVTVTLNNLVLSRYVEVLTAQNEGHQLALTAALHEHVEQSKKGGAKIITDAADYVSDQLRQSIASAVAEAIAQIREDIADARAASHNASAGVEAARSARTTAIGAASVAVVCALLAITAVVVALLH